MMSRENESVDISTIALECKNLFADCTSLTDLCEQRWLRTAHGEFNLWCAGIKATKPSSDKSSLDFRFRRDRWKDLRKDICDLLQGLAEALRKCYSLASDPDLVAGFHALELSDERSALDDSSPDSPHSQTSWEVMSQESSNQSSDEVQQDLDSVSPLLSEHIVYIRTILNQLVRITLAIRNSGNKHKFEEIDAKCTESDHVDFSRFLTVLILRESEDERGELEAGNLTALERAARASRPDKLSPVQKRLIRANVLRRNRIKAMQQSSKPKPKPKSRTETATIPTMLKHQAVVASDVVVFNAEVESTRTPSEVSISRRAQPVTVNCGPSDTSTIAVTATEPGSQLDIRSLLKKKTMSTATKMTRIGASQTYPRCPKPKSDEPLICPYCNQQLPLEILDSKAESGWRAHVVQDLLPYSCIFDDCDSPYEMYLTADALLSHTLEKHSVTHWTCDYCTVDVQAANCTSGPLQQSYESAAQWVQHVATTHEQIVSAEERLVLAPLNKRQLLPPLSCPLCSYSADTIDAEIDDHILVHLHEFSLLALPDDCWEAAENTTVAVSETEDLSQIHKMKTEDNSSLEYPIVSHQHLIDAIEIVWPILRPGTEDMPKIEQLSLATSDQSITQAASELWQSQAQELKQLLEAIILSARADEGCHSENPYCGHVDLKYLASAERIERLIRSMRSVVTTAYELLINPWGLSFDFVPSLPTLETGTPTETILEKMEEILLFPHEGPEATKRSLQPRLAIVGPSESGSSLYAATFVHAALQSQDVTRFLWIDASTDESIIMSYRVIMESSESHELMMHDPRSLLRQLNWEGDNRWLAVYDGLNRHTAFWLSSENWIPQGLTGSLLFTTSDLSCLNLLDNLEVYEIPEADWIGHDDVSPLGKASISLRFPDPGIRSNADDDDSVDETGEYWGHRDPKFAAHMSMKQALMDQGDDVPEFSQSARQSVSGHGLDEEVSLTDTIHESLATSTFTDPPRRYLPANDLAKIITSDAIEMELLKIEDEMDTEITAKYDREYRKELAIWLAGDARRVVATAFMCDLNIRQLLLFFILCRKHRFDDQCIPYKFIATQRDAGSRPSDQVFTPRIWRPFKLDLFQDHQWMFLVPIFTREKFEYDLPQETVLPFRRPTATRNKVGAFSSVSKIEIHHAHHMYEDMPFVAIKDFDRDGLNEKLIDEDWERELKALAGERDIKHRHLLSCVAAIRKGNRGYFMFPWADGNLRDFWRAAEQLPLESRVLQSVLALRGIADALATHHKGTNKINQTIGNMHKIYTAHSLNTGAGLVRDEGQDEFQLGEEQLTGFGHGDVVPENILFFLNASTELETFKLGATRPEKRRIMITKHPTYLADTDYARRRYQAPEASKSDRVMPSSDIWAMGCLMLDFIIWLLHGNEKLEEFYRHLRDESPEFPQYFATEQLSGAESGPHQLLRNAVRRTIEYIEDKDPECSQDSAVHDLLKVVRDRLLVDGILPSESDTLRPFSPGYAPRRRATAFELVRYLDDIFDKCDRSDYVVTGKSRSSITFPAGRQLHSSTVTGTDTTHLSPQLGPPSAIGVLGHSITTSAYALPPLKDWEYIVDNDFAKEVLSRRNQDWSPAPEPGKLCERCQALDLFQSGFVLEDDAGALLHREAHCDLCRLLLEVSYSKENPNTSTIRFERSFSTIRILGSPLPVLSIFRSPATEVQTPVEIQIGSPKLPEVGSDDYYVLLRLWLEDCNVNHPNCYSTSTWKYPTRLLDVGFGSDPNVRLVETGEHNISKERYLGLSHMWGVKDFLRTTSANYVSLKAGFPLDWLPQNYQDAVLCTRALGVRFLWIDALCIINDDSHEWIQEFARMEDVFSGAYCMLAACLTVDPHRGFLVPRPQRDYITLQDASDKPFYVTKNIDHFQSEIIEGAMYSRAWVLQERALARRTIYLGENQNYFECGEGIRCETMTKLHNNMTDLLGDPNFPTKAMRANRGLRIAYFQGLFKQYSRLRLSHASDRPIAIAALENRLRKAFEVPGSFGIFGSTLDGDAGLFHRSLLWRRGDEQGDGPWLLPIENVSAPSWSWTAYEGGIDYMDPPFDSAEWATEEIYSATSGGDTVVPIVVTVRDFSVAGRKPEEVNLVYDTEHKKFSYRTCCVIVARQKQQRRSEENRNTIHYVLLVQRVEEGPDSQESRYRRVGVGHMLGKFIALKEPGVKAEMI